MHPPVADGSTVSTASPSSAHRRWEYSSQSIPSLCDPHTALPPYRTIPPAPPSAPSAWRNPLPHQSSCVMNFEPLKAIYVPLRPGLCPTQSITAECRANIARQKDRAVRSLIGIDGIVHVLQIPVIHHGHQHTQTIEFPLAGKRILLPLPDANFLLLPPAFARSAHR